MSVSRRLSQAELRRLFPGDSELAGLMRARDWGQTDLGSPERWPEHLRTAVSLCLTSRIPIVLYLGPRFTVLYNDPYISFLGHAKHPYYLGRPGEECWQEIWPTIGPMLRGVVATGEATWSEDTLMFFDRHVPREEVYVRFTFGPILAPDGRTVDGIFCPCTETTEQVVGARRLETLRQLGVQASEAQTVKGACRKVADVLAMNPWAIPFAGIYVVDDSGRRATLAATAGLPEHDHPLPLSASIDEDDAAPWELASVLRTQRPREVDVSGLAHHLPGGPWRDRASRALAVPIASMGHGLAALLVAGLSTRRVLDTAYHTFFALVAERIGAALADVQAYEKERMRAEALAALDRSKTAFFSNVSHEFRTPLTLILGPVEDLLQQRAPALPAAARAQVETVHRNGLRLLRLVNTLLDFSKIEAGQLRARYEPTALEVYTAELASTFRLAIERVGARLIVDCPPLSEPAFVDRDMWEKIVLNLVSNAFKYTFEGEIEVALRRAAGDSSRVELTVRDTGIGIPAEELPHMFERFHRVEGARGRTQDGTGIGLALVHELVKLHGGSVRVESVLRQGSSFTVAIPLGSDHLPPDRIAAGQPLAPVRAAASAYLEETRGWLTTERDMELRALVDAAPWRDEPTAGRPPEPAEGRPRVLLADDNADMRDYVTRLLADRYDVEVVADGAAALAAIERRPPDLVLADVMMPRMDGFTLLGRLRAEPRTRAIPVIVLSARADEEERIEGLEIGASDYLVKPFGARELLARVGAHVDMVRHRREAAEREHALRAETEAARDRLADEVESMARFHEVSARLAQPGDLNELLERVVDAAITITGADMGNIQLLDERSGVLSIRAHRGFERPFLDFFGSVSHGTAVCGTALERGERIVVEDVALSPIFDERSRQAVLDSGARAVQATPLVSRAGRALGMFSTHYRVPRRPAERDLKMLDLLARQAADLIERSRAEDELKHLNGALEQRAGQLRVLAFEMTRAEQQERRRLGQILHDQLQQLLAAAKFQVEFVARRISDSGAVTSLRQLGELLDQSIEQCRFLTVELSPPILHHRGLVAGLSWLARQFKEKHDLSVFPDLDARAEPAEEGIRTFLFQAARELLFNCVKHAGACSVRLHLSRRDEGRLRLVVSDDGRGFDPHDLKRGAVDGGFGLFSIQERLAAIDGRQEIVSAPGLGTTMVIEVPDGQPEPAVGTGGVPGDSPEPATEPSPAARIRVVLADDHAILRQSLAQLLAWHPEIELVGQAADGREAVELARQVRPDVIVMDVTMPGLDGVEATRRITAEVPGVRIIGLSMHDDDDMAAAMRDAGAVAYVNKREPVDMLIRAILTGARGRPEPPRE